MCACVCVWPAVWVAGCGWVCVCVLTLARTLRHVGLSSICSVRLRLCMWNTYAHLLKNAQATLNPNHSYSISNSNSNSYSYSSNRNGCSNRSQRQEAARHQPPESCPGPFSALCSSLDTSSSPVVDVVNICHIKTKYTNICTPVSVSVST